MKVSNVTFNKNCLIEFLQGDDNVLFAILFGSITKGKLRKNSDLDLAIYFKKPPEGFSLLEYIQTLSEKIGIDLHLTILNTASALLKHQVIKYGKPILIKDRKEYIKFREKTITDYQEYKYVAGMSIYDRQGID